MMTLARLLSERRKADRLSLREAAQLIGISHGYLDKLEKGVDSRTGTKNNPTPETLQMIASAYHWDYQYLLKICGYMYDLKDDSLSPNLKGLLETCRTMSDNDVYFIKRFADFISSENKKMHSLPNKITEINSSSE